MIYNNIPIPQSNYTMERNVVKKRAMMVSILLVSSTARGLKVYRMTRPPRYHRIDTDNADATSTFTVVSVLNKLLF